MASRPPMRNDIFQRLPRATALLILSALLESAQASALPRVTATLPYTVLDVVAWPPLPTAPAITPNEFHELLRRQDTNTVCGYIGGDPNLPATCSPGSHCVLDRQHNAIGCCPNGQPTCSTGVFTGCVDHNSGPQTIVNPYVYTCQGSDVCYRNVFGGGQSQYGCGTASALGTTVEASASGLTDAVSLTSVQVSLTESPSTLATPTTINTSTGTFTPSTSSSASTSTPTSSVSSSSSTSSRSSSTSSSRTSSTSSSSTSSSTSQTASTSSSSTTNAPAQATSAGADGGNGSSRVDRTGAIVGGTISGVAVLIALIAVAIFFWRRKAASNVRQGPGPGGNTQYISPMNGAQGFQRLHDSQAAYETGMPPGAVSALPPAAAMYQQPPPPQQQQQQQQQQQPEGWQEEMARQQAQREMQGQQWQQQAQKWGMDPNAQVGYNENSGTVRYVEGDSTAAQVGQGNVAYVESVPDSGNSGYPYSAAAAVTPAAAGFGNATEITSPARPGSVAQAPPTQGYHYPGQYPAAYAGAPVAAAAVAGGNRGVSHGATSSIGGASSYYSQVPPAPMSPPSGPVPPPPSSAYGDASVSSVSRGMSIRGGGGSSIRSHPTPIANQFTSGAWAVHMRSSVRESTDEYARGYPDGLERIGEDEPLTTSMQDNPANDNGNGSYADSGAAGFESSTPPEGGGLASKDSLMSRASGSSNASSNGGRPLWHQNRLHSRNQMWM